MSLQIGTDKLPRILDLKGRRYVVCDELLRFDDGTMSRSRCGHLIDITNLPGIRVTDRCSGSHIAHDPGCVGEQLVHADGSPVT